MYTLTYVYRDSTAVLGPLAAFVEPHCYDLCARHADRMTAPRGWEVVRLPVGEPDEAAVADDLVLLANAVREATAPRTPAEPTGQGVEVGRKGHLRVLLRLRHQMAGASGNDRVGRVQHEARRSSDRAAPGSDDGLET